MKVIQNNTLTIVPRQAVLDKLSQIKEGATLYARVISRPGKNRAVIDMKGQRIVAEFRNGVPENDYLQLKLQMKEKGSYIFNLITSESGNLENSPIKDFILSGILSEKESALLRKLLLGGNKDLIDLNRLVLRELSSLKELPSLYKLLQPFFSSGAMTMKNISQLLSFDPILFILQNILKKNKKDSIKSNISADINTFIEFADTIDKDEKEDFIIKLLDILREYYDSNSFFHEVPIWLDDEPVKAQILKNNECCVISITLSHLGRIEVIGKKKSAIELTIIGSTSTIETLEENLTFLENELNEAELVFSVSFIDREMMTGELLKFAQNSSIKSTIDVTI